MDVNIWPLYMEFLLPAREVLSSMYWHLVARCLRCMKSKTGMHSGTCSLWAYTSVTWGGCSSVGRAGGPVIGRSLVCIPGSPGMGLSYTLKYPWARYWNSEFLRNERTKERTNERTNKLLHKLNCITQILLFTFFPKPRKLKCWADRWALTLTHVLSVSISDE